jgi:Mg2+ and Co2+ transporter CorA
MLTIAFLLRDFNSLELGGLKKGSVVNAVSSKLDDLMSFRLLLSKCLRMVRNDAFQLGIVPTDTRYYTDWQGTNKNDSDLLACDWTFLFRELQTWTEETERVISNHITNLTVIDSRRAQQDTNSFNQITTLGQFIVLVFTPLAFVYGILSMGGDFAPGNSKFWIFWVISVPLVVLTIALFIFVLQLKSTKRAQKRHGKI